MNIEKIRAFVVVAEKLNFSKAAAELGMSQPPLTRLIRGLEEDLGVKLFERTTRQVRLTAAGIYLLQEGRSLIEQSDQIANHLRAIGKLKSGQLNIGFSQTAFLASLPKILSEFRVRFPKVKVDLVHDTATGLLKRIKAGRLDLCFIEGEIVDEDLVSIAIKDETLGVSVPETHRFARRKEISFRDLQGETMILHPLTEARGFHGTIDQLFRSHGIKPKKYIKQLGESCPILVAMGRGLSLTVASNPMFENLGNRFVPIKSSFVPISLIFSRERSHATLDIFVSFARETSLLRAAKAECLLEVEDV